MTFTRVAITQPYVPAYRYTFWDHTIALLKDAGIESRVFFGGDNQQLAARARRNDSVDAPWATQVATKALRLSRALPKLTYRILPADWHDSLLLTEMQATNANAWHAMLHRRPYITFGHGKEYTSEPTWLAEHLESALNRHATRILTYTEEGRATVLERTAVRADKVVSFHNTSDTEELVTEMAKTQESDVQEFRKQLAIPPSARIALFLGALNSHKRIDLLVEAAPDVLLRGNWWIVVVGDGPDSDKIEALARTSGRVSHLGQLNPREFAVAGMAADLVVNPGRIGLVAVDALVMGLPILSTTPNRHAPEAGYLVEGSTLFSSEATPSAFANLWAKFTATPPRTPSTTVPTIRTATAAIANTIISAVNDGERK